MDAGFESIGNATLICYDNGPKLVTDPWLIGSAYYGSWKLPYRIPDEQIAAIKESEYLWLSHGHPDHLSMRSLRTLKDKKILLSDHVGGRIVNDLQRLGFKVTVLPDRKWTNISPKINILSIADYNQDAILLIDLDGTLLLDFNDASPRGWGPFVKKTVDRYVAQKKETFLFEQFGYGTTDMINFFDESGERLEPRAALRLPVGKTIGQVAATFGVSHVVPFSSMQKYQRSDSVWANEYMTPLDAYGEGFESQRCQLLPAFVRYDCTNKEFEAINPPPTSDDVLAPEKFGDDWSEQLEPEEYQNLTGYFKSIAHLGGNMDFITFRVGGEDNVIELRGRKFHKGLMFEVPRNSLMRAVKFEAFDDLLIGNFMKTTLVGKWPGSRLYPDFTPYVSKYADNGLAKTTEELKNYFTEYRHRAPLDYLRHRINNNVANAVRTRLDSRSGLYHTAQRAWWAVNRKVGP